MDQTKGMSLDPTHVFPLFPHFTIFQPKGFNHGTFKNQKYSLKHYKNHRLGIKLVFFLIVLIKTREKSWLGLRKKPPLWTCVGSPSLTQLFTHSLTQSFVGVTLVLFDLNIFFIYWPIFFTFNVSNSLHHPHYLSVSPRENIYILSGRSQLFRS